ncbi:hypothetical protein BLNAU_4004 [Blattamonas nauphoetae]|uniref:Uncharacterized protein n=1 Tax=Blattamonas nauphoetae TaxID=2049346 RepID=A0ABQ9YAW6_9EUKA|nr:hypothetical protein BLNAU_4004 [Blattamonas nauphoetae]
MYRQTARGNSPPTQPFRPNSQRRQASLGTRWESVRVWFGGLSVDWNEEDDWTSCDKSQSTDIDGHILSR